MKMRGKYEINMRFNNFVLLNEVEPVITKQGNKYKKWLCKCDCGVEFETTIKQIKKGRKSCGCLSTSNRFKSITDEQFFKTVKLNHYKNSAKKRDLDFNLSENYFFSLITNNCGYCGSPPSLENIHKKHKLFLNGIDKVDNNLGYINGNVKSCCHICNKAKGGVEFK